MKTIPSLLSFLKWMFVGLRPVSKGLLIILALSPAPSALSQIPQGFNYQAIARDGLTGNPITDPIDVKLAILSDDSPEVVIWEEIHYGVDPDDNGLFNIVVGQGTNLSGLADFSLIDWTVTPKYIRTKIIFGGEKDMGSARLWSVPYAMVADSLGGPLKKLSVIGVTENMEEPLFEVKNTAGKTVFAVYNEGVRIYVDDGDAKGTKGGFAVGSFADTKADSRNFLFVSRDSIRAYVFDDPLAKPVNGGFAVSGFNDAKRQTNDYLLISPDSVRVFIDKTPSTKTRKGGFAVGGFGDTKAYEEEYLRVTRDSTRIYVNEDATKAVKGGFAVGSFEGVKGPITTFTSLTPENYFIGHSAGSKNTTGLYNSFMGFEAGKSNTKGNRNVFLGYRAGSSNTGGEPDSLGSYNVFIGTESGLNNSSGFYNSFYGYQSGFNNTTGKSNLFLGYRSGYLNTAGNFNTFLGYRAGAVNTTGDENTFVGSYSGSKNTIGGLNSFIGYYAGFNNTTGSANSFLGNYAGYTNTTGINNVLIGPQAGYFNNDDFNVFIGKEVGYYNTTGHDNVFIGYKAGFGNSLGSGSWSNVIIGNHAGYSMKDGQNNLMIGMTSGYSTTDGMWNVFLGNWTGEKNTTGNGNVYLGGYAGNMNSTGSTNVLIGYSAGKANTTGSSNVFIGNQAGLQNTIGTGNVFVGPYAGYYETGDNTLYISNTNVDKDEALIYGEFDNHLLAVNGQLYISSIGDGATVLNLGIERSWAFQQEGTGASTALRLRNISTTPNKTFNIDTDGSTHWRNSTGTVNRVLIDQTTAATTRLYVYGGAWCTSGNWVGSDLRWKKDISVIESALPGVMALNSVNFNLRTEEFPEMGFASGRQIGLIAQDVEEVFPLLVNTDANGYKAVAYDKLSVVLLEAIKEQQQQIENQQRELDELKTMLNIIIASQASEKK